MTMLNKQVTLLQDVELASKYLESLLIAQFQRKLEGTLDEDNDDIDYEKLESGFSKLKDLHVHAITTTSDSKQITSDAKERMNKKKVELQDVLYEKRHILEDIVQCREFRSVYQDVELIPLEEFQAKAGPEYLENSDNPHQLMINRLKYELVVRTALKEQQEALQIQRKQLIKENRQAQKKVDQFDKLLDDFVQSALPLEEALAAENAEKTKAQSTEDMTDADFTPNHNSMCIDDNNVTIATEEGLDTTL